MTLGHAPTKESTMDFTTLTLDEIISRLISLRATGVPGDTKVTMSDGEWVWSADVASVEIVPAEALIPATVVICTSAGTEAIQRETQYARDRKDDPYVLH